MIKWCILAISGFLLIISCQRETATTEIDVVWRLDSIDLETNQSFATLEITSPSPALPAGDWELFYSQFASVHSVSNAFRKEHITGDYHRIQVPGQASNTAILRAELVYSGIIRRITDAPRGMYAVHNEEILVADLTILGVDSETLADLDIPNAQSRYHANTTPPARGRAPIIPLPVDYTSLEDGWHVHDHIGVHAPQALQNEADFLQTVFEKVFSGTQGRAGADSADVVLAIDPRVSTANYRLRVGVNGIEITGGDAAGVFYGIQSLRLLLPVSALQSPQDTLRIPGTHIEDGPAFPYRGLHLDIARNFHDEFALQRVIEQMSLFKLNALHLTLTNDEGWRLEIPGIPELTEVGSLRGHTRDESDRLYPAYGSGPHDDSGIGSGFLTREVYIELLKFASQRHVQIIPEIDLPGHARAAIISMKARQTRLAGDGDITEGERFLLHDPGDQSEYRSAQNYADNVICICRPSTYEFVNHVLRELSTMYNEAGVPLSVIHIGGDEIPYGAWQKSPMCKEMADQLGLPGTDQILPLFFDSLRAMIATYGATMGGWEEITLRLTPDGHNSTEINHELAGKEVIPYVWNSVWGWGREDMAYKLANIGFPVVMCNSANLYFDQAYNRDPAEPGLSWSGYVDTRTAFDFLPLNMFAVATRDRNNQDLKPEYLASKKQLSVTGAENVLGIQGQLWGETLSSSAMIDYFLFPKMLALSERAWSPAPDWTSSDDRDMRLEALAQEWSDFNSVVGREILPRLDLLLGGVDYRIPLPGAILHGDTLLVNTRFPGLEIRYTHEDRAPDLTDQVYEEPMLVTGSVRLATFDTRGRRSRVVQIR